MISKLERYSVRDKELDWFKSYVFIQQIRVYQNESLSEEKPVYTDVQQGSILRPLCYLHCSSMTYQAIIKYGKIVNMLMMR